MQTRKPRHTCTVIKQNGKWRALFRWREGKENKRKMITLPDAKTKAEAQAALRDLSLTFDATISEGARTYLHEQMDAYIDMLERLDAVEYYTLAGYRDDTKVIRRYFPTIRLRDLTYEKAQAMVATLAESYSITTVRHIKVLMSSVVNDAIKRGYLVYNPFKDVKLPKRRYTRPNALPKAERDRLREFLASGDTTRLTVAATIAMWCGMRRGEICALKWSDIDFDAKVIHVNHALAPCADGGYSLKAPKTNQIRIVPMSSEVIEKLQDWHLIQLKEAHENAEKAYTYVLGKENDTPLRPDILSSKWAQLSAILQLRGTADGKRPTFHDLRHTFATAAIAAGVDIKTVSTILGHASAAMTLDVYASFDAEAFSRATDKLENTM